MVTHTHINLTMVHEKGYYAFSKSTLFPPARRRRSSQEGQGMWVGKEDETRRHRKRGMAGINIIKIEFTEEHMKRSNSEACSDFNYAPPIYGSWYNFFSGLPVQRDRAIPNHKHLNKISIRYYYKTQTLYFSHVLMTVFTSRSRNYSLRKSLEYESIRTYLE